MSDRGKLAGSDRSCGSRMHSVRQREAPEEAGFRGAGAIAKVAGRQD
ncbi:MAG TPA: hypothetical protein V6C63_11450 [Allocoleopsis sp.]